MAATAPNMGLKIWNLLTDPYDHSQLASNWAKVDQHDHTTGKGVPIPTGGIAEGAISTEKLGDEQVSAAKLSSPVTEQGAFNTATRTYRKVVTSEEIYSNSTTSYTVVDQATLYVPKNGWLIFTYQAAQKATTSNATIQLFIDGAEPKGTPAGGLTTLTAATAEVSTFFGPLQSIGSSGTTALIATKGTAEYNTSTAGTNGAFGVTFFGLTSGNHTVEVKAKAGASGKIEVKARNLWVQSRAFE